MRIGIIGGGSIGLLLCSYLCNQHEVTLYVRRDEQKNTLNKHGLFLSDMITPFPVHTLFLDEMKEADCFIVCVKQNQIAKVLPILKKVDNQIPLIFLQNGMGHVKYLQEISNDLYVGVVEHGAFRESDNHVSHTGKGTIKIAIFAGHMNMLISLTEQLNQPGFPFEIALDWKKLLAKKLIVNAVINPLTTLFDIPNNEIVNNPYIYHLAEQLCYEAAMVLNLDYKIELEKVKKIAIQTGENISSMLTDIRMGRQTEIDAISGFLIERSDCEMPYTSFV